MSIEPKTLTLSEIDQAVAEQLEPRPEEVPQGEDRYGAPASKSGAWVWSLVRGDWHPLHYSTDIGAAMGLLDSVAWYSVSRDREMQFMCVLGDEGQARVAQAESQALAICLAWLWWRTGVEHQLMEGES